MTDMQEALREAAGRDSELLLYDFFKHMTSLTLITLGGVLSISQVSGLKVPIQALAPSIILIVSSGALALYAMEQIIVGRRRAKPLSRWTTVYRWLVSGSFGLGVGAFLGAVWDAAK